MRNDNDWTPAGICSRIKDLGYGMAGHIDLYGQRLQIVSDAYPDGVGISVHVITANNSTKRALRLPVSILIGLTDLIPG